MTEIPFLINPRILSQIDGFETLSEAQIDHANSILCHSLRTSVMVNRFYEANKHRSFLKAQERLGHETFDANTGSWATAAEEFSV